jgi:prolyl 4-hydroxylase
MRVERCCLLGVVALLILTLLVFLIRRPRRRCSIMRAATVTAGERDLGDGTVVMLRVENVDPPVLVGDGFLSRVECRQLIREYETLLSRSTVYGEDGSNNIDSSRTSSTTFLPPGEPGSIVATVERRASALLSVPIKQLETLQLLRYEPAEKYDPHWDYFLNGPDADNNRTMTALVYLNDLESGDDGGGTHFPNLNLEIRPMTGRVVVWHNCSAVRGEAAVAKDCDDRTLHAGLPPTKSVKYALNIWSRNLPAR